LISLFHAADAPLRYFAITLFADIAAIRLMFSLFSPLTLMLFSLLFAAADDFSFDAAMMLSIFAFLL